VVTPWYLFLVGFGEEMVAEIRKAVCEEVRGALMFVKTDPSPIPPPNDQRAEEQLLHLALTGELNIESGSLLASEFFSPLNAEVWAAADACQRSHPEDDKVKGAELLVALEANESVVTDYMKLEIEDLFIPMTIDGSPSELKERVLEKSRARKLIEWIGKMEIELRLGNLSTQDVRQKMLRWAQGNHATPKSQNPPTQ
jgi:hypothetical protein